MTLAFVRHGETAPNVEGRLLGRSDPPLTDRGRVQARAVAAYAASLGALRVYTSPLRRAVETAAEVAAASGLEVVIDERLVEIDYGEWEGKDLAGIPHEVVRRWREDPTFAPPGGESLAAVVARVADFCEEQLAAERFIVAVSHVSPIKAAATWVLDVEPTVAWRMFVGLGTVTRVGRRGGQRVLLAFNETGHLAGTDL